MNLVTSRRNSGEIAVKVKMENDRAKVTFLPKFSGIYELLLTNDGQHLQGSPFIIRIMKNTKEVEHALQETTRISKSKIERKIISKSIDFINESVNVTEEDSFKLDTNNNANAKEPKETTEANKSDDESSYQDSGVFDISESVNRSVKPIDLEEIDEDSRFSEISDANTTDESKYSSLEYKMADDNVENLNSNINSAIKFNSGEAQEIVLHNHTPDIKFLANDFEQQLDQIRLESLPQPDLTVTAAEGEIPHEVSQTNVLHAEMEEDIFNDANDSESNQEFENLYNRIANDESTSDPEAGIETLDSTDGKIAENETKSSPLNAVQIEEDATFSETGTVMKIINNLTHIVSSNNLEDLPDTSEIQNGKRVTSSIERMVEIFEKEPTTTINKMEPIDAAKITPLDLGTAYASPIFSNIAQEAIVPEESPVEDSARLLKEDYELSSKDKRATLVRDYSICLDDDEIFNTNVKEIKRVFETKPEVKAPNKRFATTGKKQDGLQETKNKLAKSMPNLSCDDGVKDLMEEFFGEDEFLLKFKKKRNFWNNLISQNSQSSLNVSNSEINLNNAKLMSERCNNVSQSVNCLNTLPRSNKPSSPLNKYRRKKEELHKANSLDLANTYDDEFHTDAKNNKIVRAHSLYDRIRIFDKDFDSGKHTTLLKRTKERAELKEIDQHPEIPKPESLTEVPNKTSNDQIEEDLRFAEIMKERFEMSKRFFCTLEVVNTKPNLGRRHSMDSKPQATKEVPLQKGGSLKMLNVSDKFAMDNIYKDVILNKIKNSNFRGSPNRDAIVETLSSVSSSESSDFVEKNKDLLEEEDLNMQFFNIRKRLRKRRSIKSIFDINY
ncbi:hypothetical protein AMK59_2710 [Oryctes borbonicus]|uniref:Uncharacterized protein n=1 Tax=Oryctes borbonicus TaxID=1629725 RepID=A0A0T6BFD6_9SCAR|nr:hypothetical protein AMK59_2710 [Oryctes borbonicus]